jgi:hypothetical protein
MRQERQIFNPRELKTNGIIIYNILWLVDPLLGNDSEKTAMQQPLLSNRFANNHVYKAVIGNSNRGTVFSVRSVSICYKQNSHESPLGVIHLTKTQAYS